MKIQCACGAKYELDVVPGMPPVQFACQSCGQDYSAFVNELIRRELGQPPASPQTQTAAPAAPMAPPPAAPAPSGLRISRGHAAAPQAEQAPTSKYCERHRTELVTGQCQVCHKPICPQCLETFGQFCSPFCRNKIAGPMNAPVVTGQKFLAQQEFWRKWGLIGKVTGGVLFVLVGFWFWYAWIGSVPHKGFFVRWDDISHSGNSWIVDGNQLVFLHGGTLARYNLQTKQKVWSIDLVTPEQIADVLKKQDQEAADEVKHYGSASGESLQPASFRNKYARIDLESEYSLHGAGKNIWLAKEDSLFHYDWDTGKVVQQLTVTNGLEGMTGRDDEFVALARTDDGAQMVTRINMDTGEMHSEQLTGPLPPMVARTTARPQEDRGGGLPLSPTSHPGQLDPKKVAQQAQNMSLPARLALPALVGNSIHQQQINSEIDQEDGRTAARQTASAASSQLPVDLSNFELIPDGDSYIAFTSQLLHENIVERNAMKAPPKTSALNDASLSAANETAAVNEQLNELQRNNGGGTVTEDQSTYRVALRRPASTQADWVGDVTGSPQFFPQKTINVLAAGKSVTVFDKSNKQLWQAQLTYPVTGGEGNHESFESSESQFGAGPCVEHDGTLYVFDQAVLSAFDAASGSVRWRIPSVGVNGIFFDDQGKLYVNTTSGNPDDIKFSRQIDVTKQTDAIVMKVDPANGTILWKAIPGAYISYLSGKFIYGSQYYDPGDEEDETSDAVPMFKPPYFRIVRINPSNGHTMWFYNEGRAPVKITFDRNTISVVLKKEVEILHFFTF